MESLLLVGFFIGVLLLFAGGTYLCVVLVDRLFGRRSAPSPASGDCGSTVRVAARGTDEPFATHDTLVVDDREDTPALLDGLALIADDAPAWDVADAILGDSASGGPQITVGSYDDRMGVGDFGTGYNSSISVG